MSVNEKFNIGVYLGDYSYRDEWRYQRRKELPSCDTSLERLFQLIADHQYRQASLPLENKQVILHLEMIGGLGDVSQAFLCAKKIQSYDPMCKVSIAVSCTPSEEESVKSLFPTDVFETRFLSKYNPVKKEGEIKELRAKTGCLIGIATPLSSYELRSPLYRSVKEYGFGRHPDTKGHVLSMGFCADEEGLNLPEITPRSLYPLQSEWLKNAMGLHSLEDQHRYLSEKKLYCMYVSDWASQIIGLYSVAEIEKSNPQTVDVFLPMTYSLTDLIAWKALDLDELRKNNIGKLTVITPKGAESLELGHGKEMRILSGMIPKDEMEQIQQYSQPFFGCTGDNSFGEVTKRGGLPFYSILPHKIQFFKSWMDQVKSCGFGNLEKFFSTLWLQYEAEGSVYQKNTPKKMSYYASEPSYDLKDPHSIPRISMSQLTPMFPRCAEQIAGLYLQTPVVEEARQFGAWVEKNHNFEPRLIEMVSRGLVLTNYPHLLQVEQDLFAQFKRGEISEEHVVETLAHELRPAS